MKERVSSLRSLVFLLGVILAFAVFGETNYSVNVGGLLKVDSKSPNTVVGVPWVCFNTNGLLKIDVGTLVKPRNLVPGDTVMTVAENGSRVYEAWALGEDGKNWEPVVTVAKTGLEHQAVVTSAEATNRWCGRAIGLWVSRCGEGADVSKPFYVGGQYESSSITNEIVAGSMANPAWTLLSNPLPDAVDLNGIAWNGKCDPDDQLSLVTTNGVSQIYTWRAGDGPNGGKWGYSTYVPVSPTSSRMKQVRVDTGCLVEPGYAFWYIRRGGDSFEIRW